MQKLFLTIAAAACFLASCKTTITTTNPDSLAYKVPDDSAITKAVNDAYAAISFKEGEKPRTAEIKNYFIPEAQFIAFRSDTGREQIMGMGQFAAAYQQFIEGNHIHFFNEKELFGRTEQFGRVAERISTYATYLNKPDTPAARGVNSFQLIKTPSGWKVSSIIWDEEKPALKIPAYYLKK